MNAIMTGNPNLGLPTGMSGPGAGMGGAGSTGAPPRGGGNRAMEVSREEMEAIQRLQTLGFS